jgi:hypothetical protein
LVGCGRFATASMGTPVEPSLLYSSHAYVWVFFVITTSISTKSLPSSPVPCLTPLVHNRADDRYLPALTT